MILVQRLLCIVIVSSLWQHVYSAEQCEKDTDFMCHSDKRCIDSKLMCDKNFDCADRSDEANCGKLACAKGVFIHIGFIRFKVS